MKLQRNPQDSNSMESNQMLRLDQCGRNPIRNSHHERPEPDSSDRNCDLSSDSFDDSWSDRKWSKVSHFRPAATETVDVARFIHWL